MEQTRRRKVRSLSVRQQAMVVGGMTGIFFALVIAQNWKGILIYFS